MSGFDHRSHMFTDDMGGGERARSRGELLSDATHTVIVHFMISPEAMTSWLLDTDKRKINVHFLTTICRQTVFVKKFFLIFFFVYFVCK